MESSTERRQRFLDRLERVEQALTAVYRGLLRLIIVVVVAVVVYVIVDPPWGEAHQGEWFYFSIAVMLVLGWAVGQFLWLGRRQTRRQAGRRVPWTARSKADGGVITWRFQIESSADDPHTDASETPGRFQSTPLSDDARTE